MSRCIEPRGPLCKASPLLRNLPFNRLSAGMKGSRYLREWRADTAPLTLVDSSGMLTPMVTCQVRPPHLSTGGPLVISGQSLCSSFTTLYIAGARWWGGLSGLHDRGHRRRSSNLASDNSVVPFTFWVFMPLSSPKLRSLHDGDDGQYP